MTDVLFVYMTAGDEAEARTIAKALVEKRLAACVNIIPGMISVYLWDDQIHDGQEVVMIAKTVSGKLEALTETVKDLHSYDCPCIVALPAGGGYAPFLKWVENQTA